MTDPKKPLDPKEGFPEAYDRILDRLRGSLDDAGLTTWESLQARIREVVELEMAAEEMTRDELDLLSAYVERDLKSLGYYAHETGEGIAAWLHFDLNVLEQTLIKRLWDLADQTRVQLIGCLALQRWDFCAETGRAKALCLFDDLPLCIDQGANPIVGAAY
jgi:hypothetical protein